MSTRVSTKPVRLRTYAADLERARGNTPAPDIEPTTLQTTTPKKTTPVPPPIPKVTEAPINKTALEHISVPPKQVPKAAATPKPVSVPQPKPKTRPTPPPKSAPVAPVKIPAFHELQKKSSDGRKSPLGSGDLETTVIRETKKRSFNPFADVLQSISDWFKELSTQRKKKSPVYSVPDAQHRKGIIEEATSKSGTSFTADSTSLKERIRRRQAEQSKADEHDTYWSPNTDTGYALLDTPDDVVTETTKTIPPVPPSIQNVSVAHKQVGRVYIPPTTASGFDTPPAPDVTPTQPDVTPAPEPVVPTTTPTPQPPAPQPYRPASQPTNPEPVTPPQPTPPPTNPTPSTATTATKRPYKDLIESTDTNTLTLQISGAIVAVLAVVISGFIIVKSFTTSEPVTAPTLSTEATLSNAQLVPLTITATEVNTIATHLTNHTQTAPAGVVEVPVIGPDGYEVTPSYLFSLLEFNTIPTFRQSITTLHFVSINNSRPAMLLTFSDQESVRGGLLDWEPHLAADVASLYGLSSVTGLRFTDQTISGIDTRILAEEGNTILMYGFIDDQTVLITPSRADFAQILEQHRR